MNPLMQKKAEFSYSLRNSKWLPSKRNPMRKDPFHDGKRRSIIRLRL